MKNAQPKTIYLKDYQPADFIIEQVFLHFELLDSHTEVKSILHMKRNPASSNPEAPLVLNGEDMALQGIMLDGVALKPSSYSTDQKSLMIPSVPDQFVLETKVSIEPHNNKQLSGLYLSRGNYCTQCEPHGFRRITYYLDRPDVMSRFTTTITADKTKYPYLLSNGNIIESKDLNNNRHWVCWEDPSLKPSYLFALVAGDFDVLKDTYTTLSGRKIDLGLYLEKGYGDQGEYALTALKKAMRWDEETWGREYDLNNYMIVAVSDFNMGAMENKGLNIFNTKYVLAKSETATDTDYFNIEAVIGHEYFHNWSGNRVTCRDWFQITLKEGLTVFRDQTFSIDMTTQAVARIPEVIVMRNNQFAEDASPMAHPIRPDSYIEVNNFYTLTVYRKGAEVIRMVRTLITSEAFRKGLDLYFERYDGQAVTTEDFIKVMEEISGKDLRQFKRWYSQKGTPVLNVEGNYDEEKQTYQLHVKQSCDPECAPLHIPFSVGLIGSHCSDMPLHMEKGTLKEKTAVLEVTQPEQTFTFFNVKEKPIPSLLRNFSAPVKVHYPYSNEELALLVQCDSDIFSRWDASQKLATNVILACADQIHRQTEPHISDLMLTVVENLIQEPTGDFSLLSRLLTMPSESYLLSKMNGSDIEAIHKAREFTKSVLANQLSDLFLKIYERCHPNKTYQYNVEDMGKRSLKNVCLSYLIITKKSEHVQLAVDQFEQTDNMTDCMGALIALNDYEGPERNDALNSFYEQWKGEALVVNKWLGLHASSALPNTLETVQLLMDHPAYKMDNPNNVYALLCTFGANQYRFHDLGGWAYQFIADQALQLDQINPQVAARVMQPLVNWRYLDAARQTMMRKELDRIANTPNISADIYEISSKSK